jgi:hypothetical protein
MIKILAVDLREPSVDIEELNYTLRTTKYHPNTDSNYQVV